MSGVRTILVVATSEAVAKAKVKRGYGDPVYVQPYERKSLGLPRGTTLWDVSYIERRA